MAISSGASTLSGFGGLRYARFDLDVYLHYYKEYLDTDHFNAMLLNGHAETFYDVCNGLDRDTALDEFVRR